MSVTVSLAEADSDLRKQMPGVWLCERECGLMPQRILRVSASSTRVNDQPFVEAPGSFSLVPFPFSQGTL